MANFRADSEAASQSIAKILAAYEQQKTNPKAQMEMKQMTNVRASITPSTEYASSKQLSDLVGQECAVGKDVSSSRIIIQVGHTQFSISENQWLRWHNEASRNGDPFVRLATKIKQYLRLQSTAQDRQSQE